MTKNILLLLLFLSLPTMIYSQSHYSKEEVFKSWTMLTNQTETKIDFKFHFDSTVVAFIDSLKVSGIDTIGAYEEQYVGTFMLDACQCGLIPWMSMVHWISNGQTYHRVLMGCCNFDTQIIDNSVLIRYYINNKSRLDSERIMPNITSISKGVNDELLFEFAMIDHTTHYLIYCVINKHSNFTKFEEYDFENSESLFHEDNNNSILKSWRDMILNQLYELE